MSLACRRSEQLTCACRYAVDGTYEYELPSDFSDEEIDEDEAFNSEDERKYGVMLAKPVRAASCVRELVRWTDAALQRRAGQGGEGDDAASDDYSEGDFEGEEAPEGAMLLSDMLDDARRPPDSDESGSETGEEEGEEEGASDSDSDSSERPAARQAPKGKLSAASAALNAILGDIGFSASDGDSDEVPEDSEGDSDSAGSQADGSADPLAGLMRVVDRVTGAQRPRQKRAEVGEAKEEAEFNVGQAGAAAAGEGQELTLDDLLGSLEGTEAFSQLAKQLEKLENSGAPLSAAHALPEQERADRRAAYQQMRDYVSRWVPLVQQHRTARHLQFGVGTERPALTIPALVDRFEPATDMERQIQQVRALLQQRYGLHCCLLPAAAAS